MENKKVTVIVAWCGDNFGGTFGKEIPGGAAFTFRSFPDAERVARETLEFHVAGLIEEAPDSVPRWLADGDYELAFEFPDISSMLRAYGAYVSLAAISRASGISQGLLSHYVNGLKKPRAEQRRRIIEGMHKIGQELLSV